MTRVSARYFELLKAIIDLDYGPDTDCDEYKERRSELIRELRHEGSS